MTTVGDRACFGVYAQAELASDADRLVRELDREIDELVELAGTVAERRKSVSAASGEVGGQASGADAAAEGTEPNGAGRPRRAPQSARLGDHEPRA